VRANRVAQCFEIVTAFQTRNQTTIATARGPLFDSFCQRNEVVILEEQLAEWIVKV
jgi:hypothetical protein